MSSCFRHNARGAEAGSHGLLSPTLAELRKIIPPFDDAAYCRLCNEASPAQWADVLERYTIFQRLKRRAGEPAADHRQRQKAWLSKRWRAGLRRSGWQLAGSLPLGTHMITPEEVEELADTDTKIGIAISCFPTGRLLLFDLRADKAMLLQEISALIDAERHRIGIEVPAKRGRPTGADRSKASELGEFLRKVKEHHIVPLWDIQLAEAAPRKLKTAKALYRSKGTVSDDRGLLLKLETAAALQDEAARWVEPLRASVRRVINNSPFDYRSTENH